MGTTVRTWFAGADVADAHAAARARVAALESRWSRFRPASDVSLLNEAGGRPVWVAPETLALLDAAAVWWQATGGLFDPTVVHALRAAGYDRDLARGHGAIGDGEPAPGLGGLELDRRAGMATLPAGVGIDLGGIGKGRTADVVAAELAHLPGGLVDLGGDLRVWGTGPQTDGWPIAVDDLRDDAPLALLGLREGAVATSSVLRRRWSDGRRTAHHLIDPRTGRPTAGDVVTVTVVAAAAEGAEVLAKAALLTGSVTAATALLEAHGVAGLVVPAHGRPVTAGELPDLCWTLSPEVR
jgi:thiamine biosynthesis lipoprotein